MAIRLAEIEFLSPAQFALLIAGIAGPVQALPLFLHLGSTTTGGRHVGLMAATTGLHLLWYTVAAVLWLSAVRRRQYPTWQTALHVTFGLAGASLIMNALALVATSIDTRGEYASAYMQSFPRILTGPLGIILVRSPFWFVEAFVLIAIGRLVLRMDADATFPPSITHPDAVS